MRTPRPFLLACLLFFYHISQSQNITPAILNSSGGTNSFSHYQFEWSFGEAMAINTMASAANLIVTNGVLEPNTQNPATINKNEAWASDEIKILPTPTSNFLEINFFSKQKGKVTMSLLTETGQLLISKQFLYYGNGHIEYLALEKYPCGQYFINIVMMPISGSVRKKGAFKIQKIK